MTLQALYEDLDQSLSEAQSPLALELESRVKDLVSSYRAAFKAGKRGFDLKTDIGEPFAKWFLGQFSIGRSTTPRRGKKLKAVAKLFLWTAENAPMSRGDESGIREIETRWAQFKSNVPDLVSLFSAEGGKDVLREMKTSVAKYVNTRGVATATFKRYVKHLDAVLGSLKGWRRKAISSGLMVSLAGPDAFRGKVAGRYNAQHDIMYVRATPAVMKRSSGTYGSSEYILIHELGHRYEVKAKATIPNDIDRERWTTTRYSMAEGPLTGRSERFAELFALGHFGMRKVRNEFGDVIDRFEKEMG